MRRIRVYLLRRLLNLRANDDVAIVSIVDGLPIVTHGYATADAETTAHKWIMVVTPSWSPSEYIH